MSSNIKDIYSLTPSQEGMYAQYSLHPDSKTYHLRNLVSVSTETDTDKLRKSVGLLSVRHPALKTAFTVLKSTGAVKQVVLENRFPEFGVIETNEAFSQHELDRIVAENTEKPMDLQREPLFRVTVIDFTDARFLLFYAHHIILDGWCLPVIINDLQKYYGRLSSGCNEEELLKEIEKEAEKATSYAEYTKWIRNQDKTEASAYWKTLLEDYAPVRIFGKENHFNTEKLDFVTFRTPLENELSQQIEQFAKKNRISTNSVFECAFGIALQKYSGSEDVVFDQVISGRSIPLRHIENTIGPFINTVPVRIKNGEGDTFGDLLGAIHRQTVEANKYGILPLSEIYKISDTDKNAVDALFVFENYFTGDADEIKNGSLSPELISSDEHTEFNLTVTVIKDGDDYVLRTTYAKEVYTHSDVTELINGYVRLLSASLDAEKKIKDIAVVDRAGFDNFNKTDYDYSIPEKSTLYSLFEKTAKENENKICIKTAEKEMTFGELCRISENLDAEIREITNNTKSVIAVICERSAEMYSAIYGIIRGGNAYLPIDPNYPTDRIEYILKNSNAKAVVTQNKFTHLANDIPCIDMTEFINKTHKSDVILSACSDENDTAYVIYTSGSTGNPKGAKVSHKSAVNRIMWMHEKYPLNSDDVILQKTPYTFDVSVWELFWWGMVGGCLAASKPDEHFLPEKILLEAEKNKVTHIHFVPSVFEIFLNYLESHKDEISKFESVKYVFLSGEALSASLVQRFYKLYDFNNVTLHNLYGPTECAVDVTYYDCTPDECDPVPIGKPIYNTQMHVVDKYMNLVPVGVQGELCIAGVNVGQGYLNNETLTNEKFIDNPFGEGKLYKTGDLAYWREDGNIIFCGRNDFQVKIHGQRIELGEIENAVSSLDGIIMSVAVVREDKQGRQFICVFYTGEEKEVREIKEQISGRLPKYMVPNVFVYLPEMPLTSSGKINRKALPETDLSDNAVYKEIITPDTNAEKTLSEIVCSVLRTDKISMTDNFFDLGGDSINAIYIVSAVEEKGYELHVSDILHSDTFTDIANAMKPTSAKEIYEQDEVNGFVEFTPVMKAFMNEVTEIPRDFVQRCVINADCDENIARSTFDILVSHHDMLRGKLCENGIEVHSSEDAVYSFRALSIDDTDEATEYLNNADIDENYLVNIIFCKTADKNLISVAVHHFLTDLISWEILIKDFMTVSSQIKNNKVISLPAKTASFKMWNEKLHDYSETISEKTKDYWQTVNTALDKASRLCADDEEVNKAESFSCVFEREVTEKLINNVCKAYGVRSNEVLLTVAGLAAGSIADGSVGLMVESHGRTEINTPVSTDRTVGWFTSCYPVVINSNDDTADELIKTKETLRKIPGNVIDYLLLNDSLSKNADIIFNFYQNSTADEQTQENLISFNTEKSVFPGKININCVIDKDILTVTVSVPECRHKKHICEELVTEIREQLEKLIDICTADDTVTKTCSDYSDDELTQSELDELKNLFDWTDD